MPSLDFFNQSENFIFTAELHRVHTEFHGENAPRCISCTKAIKKSNRLCALSTAGGLLSAKLCVYSVKLCGKKNVLNCESFTMSMVYL